MRALKSPCSRPSILRVLEPWRKACYFASDKTAIPTEARKAVYHRHYSYRHFPRKSREFFSFFFDFEARGELADRGLLHALRAPAAPMREVVNDTKDVAHLVDVLGRFRQLGDFTVKVVEDLGIGKPLQAVAGFDVLRVGDDEAVNVCGE